MLPPLAALALHLTFRELTEHVRFLFFYPAVFLSSWLGGRRAGLVATALSGALVWWFFVPPEHAFRKDIGQVFPIGVFLGMGVAFSVFHDRLRRAHVAIQRAHAEIISLYAKTKELDELKSQLFASVSHELRTPLSLILGPTERLLASPSTPAAVRHDLETVARNAQTLLGRVNNVLDLAKLEAGRLQPEYTCVDLARSVRFVSGHFEVLADEKRVAFAVDAPAELTAQVDLELFQRVVLNLLSNAFKFTPDGGRVRLTLRKTQDRAHLEVADSGPGIPPDKRDVVFERFRQLEGGRRAASAARGSVCRLPVSSPYCCADHLSSPMLPRAGRYSCSSCRAPRRPAPPYRPRSRSRSRTAPACNMQSNRHAPVRRRRPPHSVRRAGRWCSWWRTTRR